MNEERVETPESDREVDRRTFGSFLRNARRGCKLSQAALAKAARVSPVFISQIETGQRIPSDQVVKSLAVALELPWQEVLRRVYLLRSREAGELFAEAEVTREPMWQTVTDIPSLRLLLLQLASLKLSPADVETLVNNWNNDVQFLKGQLSKVQNG